MKTLTSRNLLLAAAASLLALLPPVTAQAQSLERLAVVNVPFAFAYGSHQMPAGEYSVSRIGNTMVTVRSLEAIGTLVITPAYDRDAAKTGKVVFDKIGDLYFLRQIFSAGSSEHSELPVSKAEKQALRPQFASNKAVPSTIEVAALEPVR